MADVAPIRTKRLALDVMDDSRLLAMYRGDRTGAPYAWPDWWPDDEDRAHLAWWRKRAPGLEGRTEWGPRAVVDDATATMVGHAGFHLPPRPLAEALRDPSFEGTVPDAPGGAVEVGYRVFPDSQRRGYATETVRALLGWARGTGEVTTVLASVAETNLASLAVLDRLGGFGRIGTCRDPSGSREIVLMRRL